MIYYINKRYSVNRYEVNLLPKQDYFQKGQLTDLAYLILVSLTTPCHGYLIMNKIEEVTEGNVIIGPASLYTTLKKLTQAKFIQLLEDDGLKKVYSITNSGYEALDVEIKKRERYALYGKNALNKIRRDSHEEI